MATPGDTSDANQQPQPQPQPQPRPHHSAALGYDEKSIRAFFKLICDPAVGCTELRIFKADVRSRPERIVRFDKFNKTIAGWFDKIEYFFPTVAHIDGVSAYVTVNPVTRDLIGRATNRVRSIATGEGSKDTDVLFHRWLYVDIDPERPSGISATHEELAAAIAVRDQILADHPSLAASAAWGCSGNGGWILVRLADLPATDDTYALIGSVLDRLASRYGRKGRDKVSVDQSTKNAARVMCLPGTVKAKGDPQPDRPWRMVTIDGFGGHGGDGAEGGSVVSGVGGWHPEPWDIGGWLAENPDPDPEPASGRPESNPFGVKRGQPVSLLENGHLNGYSSQVTDRLFLLYRAATYVSRIPPAISGHEGHNETFDVACALVKGFDLTPAEAWPILDAYNSRCQPPWSAKDLEHKLRDADAIPDDKPRGYLRNEGRKNRPSGNGNGHGYGTGREFVAALVGAGGFVGDAQANGHAANGDGESDAPNMLPDDDPHRLAALYMMAHHSGQEGRTLQYWQEEFYAWDGAAYRRKRPTEIRAQVAGFLHGEFLRLYQNALMRYAMGKNRAKAKVGGNPGDGGDTEDNKAGEGGGGGSGGGRRPKCIPVTTGIVSNVIQALTSYAVVPVENCNDLPAWLREHPWEPAEVLPARNALIHLPSLMYGLPHTWRPTPHFFSTYALSYEYNPDSPSPELWLSFLRALWGGDQESIDCLQEWMGYLLTPDTSLQKILTLIGPKRSGKGTIVRVVRAMIGHENVCNPTLSSLATQFGLAPLIGKPAAIITDARISGRTDTAIVVERLLTVSGEDALTIDRKHRDEITVKLPTRFVLLSNELPKIKDTSEALVGRMIFLKLVKSFYGREDTSLFSKLLPELPSILRWSIEGWIRLRNRGRFIQPKEALGLVNTMSGLSSPVGQFIRERCVIGPEFRVLTSDLFNTWRTWCQAKAIEHSGSEESFGRDLMAFVSIVDKKRYRVDGIVRPHYVGVRLLADWEMAQAAEKQGEDEEDGDADLGERNGGYGGGGDDDTPF